MSAEPMKSAFAHAEPIAAPLTYAPRPTAAASTETMVRQYLPLVRRLAWHVHGSMSTLIDIEDLVQVGLVALVEAMTQPHERGPAFTAYLSTRLRGSMIDELRRQATSTRGAMRRRRAFNDAVTRLTSASGAAPTEAALAIDLGVTVDKLRADYASAEAIRFDSIDDLYSDDLPWFADDGPNAFEQLAESDLRDTLVQAIGSLPEREAQVVQMYYVDELNLEEIGMVLGVGSARVCQIKASAQARLKKILADKV